jgi:hypothetical protein
MLVSPLGPVHSNLVADGIQFLCNDLNRRGVGCTWGQTLDRYFAQPEPWKQGEGARWRTNLTVTVTESHHLLGKATALEGSIRTYVFVIVGCCSLSACVCLRALWVLLVYVCVSI